MRKLILPLIVAGTLIFLIAGCNNPEQNFNFKQGDSLQIDGPTTVTLKPDTTTADTTDRIATTADYGIVYATTNETYKWSVSGNAKSSPYRYNAQRDSITFPVTSADSTMYTIKVNGSKYNGSLKVKVCHSLKLTKNGFCM